MEVTFKANVPYLRSLRTTYSLAEFITGDPRIPHNPHKVALGLLLGTCLQWHLDSC